MVPFVKTSCVNKKNSKLSRKRSEQAGDVRPLRADALRNVDSLLGAAMAVFEASGVDAPIREIADKAGVGVGTVYRHFPQRSDLIVAVLKTQIDSCADAAEDFAGQYRPGEALRHWMQRYVDLLAQKRGFAGALHSGDSAYTALATYFFKRMEPALQKLLEAASAAKAIRTGVRAGDLLRAVATLCHGPDGEQPSYTRSMVQLLMDGMRYGSDEPARSRAIRNA